MAQVSFDGECSTRVGAAASFSEGQDASASSRTGKSISYAAGATDGSLRDAPPSKAPLAASKSLSLLSSSSSFVIGAVNFVKGLSRLSLSSSNRVSFRGGTLSFAVRRTNANGEVPGAGTSNRRCCCGLVRLHGNDLSPVVKKLQDIDRQLRGVEESGRCPWIESTYVNMFFGFLIFLNSACIGLDISTADEDGNSAPSMAVIESFFLVAFWVEIILRMISHGPKRFCLDIPWGPFDLGVTFLGSVDAWVLSPLIGSSPAMAGISSLRILRVLRIFRLIRALRAFRELARLTKVLLGAFKSLTWLALLLFVFLYSSAILVRTLLAGHEHDDPDMERFTRGLGWTLFFHTMILTVEGHLDHVVWPTVRVSTWWYCYWVFLIIFLNFFVVNMMVGLIVMRTIKNTRDEMKENHIFLDEATQFKKTLLQLFSEADIDEVGHISTDEIVKLMEDSKMKEVMSVFGIKTDMPKEFLLTIFGFQDDKFVSFARFFEACVRMCGASRNVQAFMLQYEISSMRREVSKGISRVKRQLGIKDSKSNALFRIATESLAGSSRRVLLDTDGLASFPARSPRASGPSQLKLPSARPPQPLTLHPSTCPSPSPLALALPPLPETFVAAPPPTSSLIGDLSRPWASGANNRWADCSDGLYALLHKARKRFSLMERRQEEMLLSLAELRVTLLGASHWAVVCCKKGHPLMPLGTSSEPVGSADYRHWTCDGSWGPGGCRHGESPACHLSKLRRHHCKLCRYDICELCYSARQREKPPPEAFHHSGPMPSQPLEKQHRERIDTSDSPPCEGN